MITWRPQRRCEAKSLARTTLILRCSLVTFEKATVFELRCAQKLRSFSYGVTPPTANCQPPPTAISTNRHCMMLKTRFFSGRECVLDDPISRFDRISFTRRSISCNDPVIRILLHFDLSLNEVNLRREDRALGVVCARCLCSLRRSPPSLLVRRDQIRRVVVKITNRNDARRGLSSSWCALMVCPTFPSSNFCTSPRIGTWNLLCFVWHTSKPSWNALRTIAGRSCACERDSNRLRQLYTSKS